MKRAHVPYFVSRILGGRPVRWTPPERRVGDYDGRERTLHVFNVDVKEQRSVLERIDGHRASLEEAAGGPLVIVFHSVKQSSERYADFLRSFPRVLAAPPEVAPSIATCLDAANEGGPHRRVA